jgi:predicted Zn-dependent protease
MKKIQKYIPLFLVWALTASCATTSVSTITNAAANAGLIDQAAADAAARMGDALQNANAEISPSEEYYIGRAVSANILSTYKIYTADPALTAYVNKVLNALAINSPRPDIYNGYHAAILDSTEINAFSTSGGHIFITRGLLACSNSEDALASVLAHELAHIQLQHSIKAIKNSRFTGALQQVAGIAAEAAGMNTAELSQVLGESVQETINTMMVNGYSQDQEFEADATALSLLASAGYTPSSILDMLDALKKNGVGQTGGFSKTHPSADSRITNVNKTLSRYQVADTRTYRKLRFDAIKK